MKKLLPFSLLIFITALLSAQPTFQMRYGSHYRDEAKKVIQTQDGNFLVVGSTRGFGSGGNALIMKVNAAGTLLWVKDYSGINAEQISDIIELPDTKLVMCGITYSYGAGSSDAFVMKTDSAGTLIWARAYGDILDEHFVKIMPDDSGGFYVAGPASDVSNMQSCGTVSRMDNAGNIIWTRKAGSPNGDITMTPVASGGVILGVSLVPGTDFALWKFSPSGNLVWSHNYQPTPVYGGYGGLTVIENSSGELYVNFSLINQNTVAVSLDNFLIKLDSGGNLIWDKAYGGTYTDEDVTIENTADGGIILCGITNSAGNGDKDAYLSKVRSDGSVQWSKAYGTVWGEIPSAVFQTADDGFIFTGQTWPVGFDYDSSKVHLVKTDSLGNSDCNTITWFPVITNHTVSISAATPPSVFVFPQDNSINWNLNNRYLYQEDICHPNAIDESEIAAGNWKIYPNPFSATATIETQSFINVATFELYDVFGQLVKQIPLTNSKTEITRNDLANGIYIYQIVSENKVVGRGKLSVQ